MMLKVKTLNHIINKFSHVKIDFTIIHIFITKINVYIEKEITNKYLIDNLF